MKYLSMFLFAALVAFSGLCRGNSFLTQYFSAHEKGKKNAACGFLKTPKASVVLSTNLSGL